jgi:superfamily II DNA or RNA helicase
VTSVLRLKLTPGVIAAWLKQNQNEQVVVLCTYQSQDVLSKAAKQAKLKFDLAIFDEAHRTAGREGSAYGLLLANKNLKAKKRLFLTATPRIYKGDRDDVVSMDDKKVYGDVVYDMSFKAAIEKQIICPFEIIVADIASDETKKLLDNRDFVQLQQECGSEVVRIEDLVSACVLRRSIQKFGLKKVLAFQNSTARCAVFERLNGLVDVIYPELPKLKVFHVNGDMTSAQREGVLRDFGNTDCAVITNVRVFAEGVDCPAIDAVIFCDPRQSTIDIVQGSGRCMRNYAGKKSGYVLIPTVMEDGQPDDRGYTQLVKVVCALGSQDKDVVAYFESVAQGKAWAGRKIVDSLGSVDVGVELDCAEFLKSLSVKVYDRTCEWGSFEETREYVRTLRLKGQAEWQAYSKSGKRPSNIPSSPNRVYADSGWASWGDWLGGSNLPFEKAREFASKLRLKGQVEWKAYSKSGKRPSNIPSSPNRVYADSGWASWGDWLGTKVTARRSSSQPFDEAREFARKLGLKSGAEWNAYSKSGKKPSNIPSSPGEMYADNGWVNWGDWLGTGTVAPYNKQFVSFSDGRKHSHRLGLKSGAEWNAYSKSGKRPSNIPSAPNRVYANKGWISWGDWLGTDFSSFEEAREFAIKLRLKGQVEWKAYSKSGKRPSNIPSVPEKVYANKGWVSWGDWLGTDSISCKNRVYQSLEEAREFARKLGLKSGAEWNAYSKSGKRPINIPSAPNRVYANSGWVSWMDWLGTDNKQGWWKKC